MFTMDAATVVRDLENAGIEHRQAEAIVSAIARAQDGLATKSHLEAMEARMVAGLADLRADGAAAVARILLAVVATAGVLFAAIKFTG